MSTSEERIATPGRVLLASLPAIGMVVTPVLPFATTPTLWWGMPAVLVWMALMVVATVVGLQFVDWQIRRADATPAAGKEQDR